MRPSAAHDPRGASPRHGCRFSPERGATALMQGLALEAPTVSALTPLDLPTVSSWGCVGACSALACPSCGLAPSFDWEAPSSHPRTRRGVSHVEFALLQRLVRCQDILLLHDSGLKRGRNLRHLKARPTSHDRRPDGTVECGPTITTRLSRIFPANREFNREFCEDAAVSENHRWAKLIGINLLSGISEDSQQGMISTKQGIRFLLFASHPERP
jgi:hypothetical protein